MVYIVVMRSIGLLSLVGSVVDMIVDRWYLKEVGGKDLVRMSDVGS